MSHIEYLIAGLIGWFIGGGMGVVVMSLLVVASQSDDKMGVDQCE